MVFRTEHWEKLALASTLFLTHTSSFPTLLLVDNSHPILLGRFRLFLCLRFVIYRRYVPRYGWSEMKSVEVICCREICADAHDSRIGFRDGR
jgi:hypothetical protein